MTSTNSDQPLTVVLVHGAFADASGWNGVCDRLLADGVQVMAPSNPLRGIAIDSAYIKSVLGQIEGPVLAVGHSYGGAVLTNAATEADNVVGLVYVAAFAPAEGERLIDAVGHSRDSVLNEALVQYQYPTGSGEETAVEFAIDPAKFHDAFAVRPAGGRVGDDGRHPASGGRSGVLGADGGSRVEERADLDGGCHRRHRRRGRRDPLDGRAVRVDHHRGRGLARDHGLATGEGRRM